MYAQKKCRHIELAAIALGATSPKITRSDLDRYKRMSPEERLYHLRKFSGFTVFEAEGEYRLSYRSLEEKLAILWRVQSVLAAKGVEGVSILSPCRIFTYGANGTADRLDRSGGSRSTSLDLRPGEIYEHSNGHSLYHYSVCGRTHASSQDYLLSILFTCGARTLELHAALDGASGCSDGAFASRRAGQMLSMAAQLGLITTEYDLYSIMCAINRELYNLRSSRGDPHPDPEHLGSLETDAVVALIDRTIDRTVNRTGTASTPSFTILKCGWSQAMLAAFGFDRVIESRAITTSNTKVPLMGVTPALPPLEQLRVISLPFSQLPSILQNVPKRHDATAFPGISYILAFPTDGFIQLLLSHSCETLANSINNFLSRTSFAGLGQRFRRPTGPGGARDIGSDDDASLLLVGL